MNRKLIFYVNCCLLVVFSWSLARTVSAQEEKSATISFCHLMSKLDSNRGKRVTIRVRVKTYRHGTTISDRTCQGQ
jgi:hypothetical protein